MLYNLWKNQHDQTNFPKSVPVLIQLNIFSTHWTIVNNQHEMDRQLGSNAKHDLAERTTVSFVLYIRSLHNMRTYWFVLINSLIVQLNRYSNKIFQKW